MCRYYECNRRDSWVRDPVVMIVLEGGYLYVDKEICAKARCHLYLSLSFAPVS